MDINVLTPAQLAESNLISFCLILHLVTNPCPQSHDIHFKASHCSTRFHFSSLLFAMTACFTIVIWIRFSETGLWHKLQMRRVAYRWQQSSQVTNLLERVRVVCNFKELVFYKRNMRNLVLFLDCYRFVDRFSHLFEGIYVFEGTVELWASR